MLNSNILLSYGFGDGGGGPTREQIQNIRILNELPGAPHIKQGRVDAYFDQLQDKLAPLKSETSTWRGELYLEFHRGTYTSQAWIKSANRRAEFALRAIEIRYTTAWVNKEIPYPVKALQDLWQILLRNQFHDILPGSSIHEVYEDAHVEFNKLFSGIKALNESLDKRIIEDPRSPNTSSTSELIVFNPLAWKSTQVLTLPNGNQVLATVPGLTAAVPVLEPLPQTPTAEITPGDGLTITTAFYELVFNTDGQLLHLVDRNSGREYLSNAGGNILTVYEDRPLEYDNWNIDSDYTQKAELLRASNYSIVENTPLQTVLEFHYAYRNSTVDQRIIMYATNPRIDFVTHADWHEHQVLLRTAFDTTIKSDNARFDIQYGNVQRSTDSNNSWEKAKFETVAHQWVDLSERDCGVALLNNAKYGYRVKGRELSLSLIKSGINPDYDADQGAHEFTYSILPHTSDWLVGSVMQAAAELNQPLQITNTPLPSLFSFDSEFPVAVDAIKQSEDGRAVILRLHDDTNGNQTITIHPNFAHKQVSEVNLDEETNSHELTDLSFSIKPYQIVTLRFAL